MESQVQKPVHGDSLGDDLLNGVNEIARFIDRSPRQTYYLLQTGKLPATKGLCGWTSMKSRIRRHIEDLVDGKVA